MAKKATKRKTITNGKPKAKRRAANTRRTSAKKK